MNSNVQRDFIVQLHVFYSIKIRVNGFLPHLLLIPFYLLLYKYLFPFTYYLLIVFCEPEGDT